MSAASPLGNLNSPLRNLMNSVVVKSVRNRRRRVDGATAVRERRGRGAASCLLLTVTCSYLCPELDVGETLLNCYRRRAVRAQCCAALPFSGKPWRPEHVKSKCGFTTLSVPGFLWLFSTPPFSNLNAGGKALARQGNVSFPVSSLRARVTE